MRFLRSVKDEMKLVQWPTWKENRHDTMTVIMTSIVCALFLGACDWIFQKLLTMFVTHR
ncbi:preprotein translocase subunit SecE [Lactobacillus sp. DCY120]|uniref:Protein translocase subunit SecE n=1 Tax=Bombilactobacillus apium TaxID=2675299 RepID=A0A850R9B2_9LACO|nr:preprotein translocase subunit SecE [Bombilactobacillus apium]NVY95986.1 preprotein translocase subunit SecE [Bombilactobacillus apium]